MRNQLAEQEAVAEQLLAEKEAAVGVAEQLWAQLHAVQEQAVDALHQLEDAEAHKERLHEVGGAAVKRCRVPPMASARSRPPARCGACRAALHAAALETCACACAAPPRAQAFIELQEVHQQRQELAAEVRRSACLQ